MFYTRIPCGKNLAFSNEYMNKSSRYFPLIGWIVGGFSYVLLYCSLFVFSTEIAVIISMIAGILLTGAFHEDGFADVCDGFGGGWNKQKILEIMKDSRIGAYGVIGLVLLMLMKFFLLENIISVELSFIEVLLIFVSAHSISRLAAISIVFTDNYVREDKESKSKPIAQNFTWKEVFGSFFFGLLPLIFLSLYQFQFVIVLIPIIIVRFLMAAYFKKWISGYTGDCLGATQQLCEIVFYLSVIAIWKFI